MKLAHLIVTAALSLTLQIAIAASSASLTIQEDTIEPNKPVTVTMVSYSFDVETLFIEWFVNGAVYTSGLGLSSISVTPGNIGDIVRVNAKVTSPLGEQLNVGINLTPASVDLAWEALESYVPPFYEGKALPGEGAILNLTAIPNMSENGRQLPPESIAYAWFVNEEALLNGSGINKQTAKIPLETLTNVTDIKVRARAPGGAIAEKSIQVSPHDILPLVYTYDDVLGLNRSIALFRRFETTKAFTLSFEPYYFSIKSPTLKSAANFLWMLDGLPVTPQENTLLTLKPRDESYGTKELKISLESTKRFLQRAETSLEIIFDTR